MVRKKGFHSLKKIRIRQSWNKINLFNLSRLTTSPTIARTFFQQKWTAKAEARAYHGEQIRERQWTRMFSRYIPSVVPMDAKELAHDDGSAQGAGRGSGKDVEVKKMVPGDGPPPKPSTTPYMGMTFYPTERRLDTAIFRALFASSARQARQFCVNGFVKVNGKKMKYPGYLLNPGDLFSVHPDMVMFATGAKKKRPSDSSNKPRERQSDTENREDGPVMNPEAEENDPFDEVWEDEPEEDVESATAAGDTDYESSENDEEDISKVPAAELKARRKGLIQLRDEIKAVATTTKGLKAKRKQELRALFKEIRSTNFSKIPRQVLQRYQATFAAIKEKIENPPTGFGSDPVSERLQPVEDSEEDALGKAMRTEMQQNNPHLLALKMWPNKRDKKKTYMTPWRPRPYMSAFAFIPRYLEVNQNVCSAVYLRDPVARPGLAEVPSPFHQETNQLAFQWYLRRR